MSIFIKFFIDIANELVNILNSIKIGNYSYLFYILGALILSSVFKLFSSSSREVDRYLNSDFKTSFSKYSKDLKRRKQLIDSNKE